MTRSVALIAGVTTLFVEVAKLVWLAGSKVHERRGAYVLLSTVLSNLLLTRFLLLCSGLLTLSLAESVWARVTAAIVLIAGEFVGRYLFFVSVVPTNIATEYLSAEAA